MLYSLQELSIKEVANPTNRFVGLERLSILIRRAGSFITERVCGTESGGFSFYYGLLASAAN